MTMRRYPLSFGLLLCAGLLHAQSNFLEKWQARATATQAVQPSWSVPIVAPYPMLIQVFRTDVTRQITPGLTPTWNYGDGRGLNLIPGFRSEFDIYNPPYLQHNSAQVRDGFGDVGVLYKYRILSANENNGNYLLSAQVSATVPTGTYTNGSREASISPTLLAGKGFSTFDVISSLGGALPCAETASLGRSVVWNTTAQYHAGKYLWPEIEDNATYFHGGSNDGKMENFLTPGITIGKIKLHPQEAHARAGLTLGGGLQIGTSAWHAYNHNLVFTGRFIF